MRRRGLSPAVAELGIHERELARVNAVVGQRDRRPKVPDQPAPLEWNLVQMCEQGYLLCRGCQRPTSYAPESTVCVLCGSPKVEFQEPVFSR
jgi:hypothetical protein